MNPLRLIPVLLLCVACCSTELMAKPTANQLKKARAKCDAVFDLALDNCLGGGWGPTECLESAAASRAECMRKHGIDQPYPTRQVPPSKLPSDRVQGLEAISDGVGAAKLAEQSSDEPGRNPSLKPALTTKVRLSEPRKSVPKSGTDEDKNASVPEVPKKKVTRHD